MTDTVTQLPDLSVVLDLDSAERPEEDVKPPFIVKVGDRKVQFKDPNEIDWKVLAEVDHPADLIRISLTKEDRKHVMETNLPGWKFNRLISTYYDHYDLEDKIREAKRRAAFGG